MFLRYLTEAIDRADIADRDEYTEVTTFELGLITLQELQRERLCDSLFMVVYRERVEEGCLVPKTRQYLSLSVNLHIY